VKVAIRPGSSGDLEFVQRVATAALNEFGDYGRIVPEWLSHDGVLTFVAEHDAEPVGFIMVGFYRLEGPGSDPRGEAAYAADLLAIAVAPEAERRGVGRQLLDHAVVTARAARKRLPVRELRLSVADTNERARRRFVAAGFALVPGEHGRYDRGQRALHMSRPL
jgi:ribosomal protein S18 acetylase RimI-like enzyme